MGSKFSKWRGGKNKSKKHAVNNNPRNPGSTQSLNTIGNGSVSNNPYPGANYQAEVTNVLTRAQSEGTLTAEVPRSETQQARKTTVPVQKKNSYDVIGIAKTSQQRQNTEPILKSGVAYHTQNKAGSTTSAHGQGSVSANPEESVYAKPEVANTRPRTQNVEAPPVAERRRDTQRAQTIAIPVQRGKISELKPKVIATMDCVAEDEGDLSFKTGDIMELINDVDLNGWYFARNFTTREEGRVPTNCVEMMIGVDVESQKVFFQLNKQEAEEKLQGTRLGTYLIRRSADTGAYALSLRCEKDFYDEDIKHYKIRIDDKGVCYIDADVNIKPFSNIMDLIRYYTEEPGLQCKLTKPLPRDTELDDLAVKFSDLRLGEKLGSGNFGSVYAGILHGRQQAAVKSLRAGGSMTVEEFRQEAKTMHKLRHPNLVSLLAICENNGKIYIITEKMPKGSLLALLREDDDPDHDTHTITFADLMEMAAQVVEGMCYLEMTGFVHRDLRAANVLVGDGNITKIADFGLTRLLDNYYGHEHFYQEKKEAVFPYKWTAPEAIKKQRFTVKSDVWSFGILLYEMVTYGDEPYAATANPEVLKWLEAGNRLERPVDYHCPLALYDIMRQCWMATPKDRPEFSRVKENLLGVDATA